MATADTPFDDTKRQNLVLAGTGFPPALQHVMNQEVGGSNASQQPDFKSRGKKRSLDETDMGPTSGVAEALQQDYILRANTNPVYFQPSEKHPKVFVGEVNNRDQSMAKRPRLGCAECLASDPNSGDLPSGGSITPSGLRHSRLSTATAVASLQRQPECLTNPSFFAPLVRQKGDGDAPHCPASIRPGIQSQDPSSSTRLVLPHRPSSEPTAQHNTLILNSPTLPVLYSQSSFLSPIVNNSWNADTARSSSLPPSNTPSMGQSSHSFYFQHGHLTEATPDITLTLPASTSAHKPSEDQMHRYQLQSTATVTKEETEARNKAAQMKEELKMMRRDAELQAGRLCVIKGRKIGVGPVPPQTSKVSKEPASSSSASLASPAHEFDRSNFPPSIQNKPLPLSSPNLNPAPESPNPFSSVTSSLVKEQPNSGSNPSAVSHTLPTLPRNHSPSPIPESASDQNIQELNEVSKEVISTTLSGSFSSTGPTRQGSLPAPDTSRQATADSHTADVIPPKLSFPELKLTPSESEGLSEVIAHHADSVLKLFQKDLANVQQNHDLEMARLQFNHGKELATLREAYSREVDTRERLLAAVSHEKRIMMTVAKTIQNTVERLREKLWRTELKSKELHESFERKIAEQKEQRVQQQKENELQIASLTREWSAEKRGLEECIHNERMLRRSESEARRTLENEKVAFTQNIAKLNEDKSNYEAVQQKLEIWAKQMQVALEKQAENHQTMMQSANLVWEERVKAAMQIGMQKGETMGFELGKAEATNRVKELTEALSEAEKARLGEKEIWNVEREKIMEERRALKQQASIDSKKVEELTQQAIKNLDQHWTKEIETRWANLMVVEGKKQEEERVRRGVEDAARTTEIEKRDRQIAELEGKLTALQQELEDRLTADMNSRSVPSNPPGPGQFSRMEAKSVLEEYVRRGTPPTAPVSGLNDPCRVQ